MQHFQKRILMGLFISFLILVGGQTHAMVITLDADTAATGANLASSPLVTAAGEIGFTGRIHPSPGSDPDFIAVGASGNNFNIGGTSGSATPGVLSFEFDVFSLDFIFGGNGGSAYFEARDIGGYVVDSFTQESTENGQFAGPLTLAGAGIRSLVWYDSPGWNFLGIDNLTITTEVPEPGTMMLMLLGLMGLSVARFRRV